MNKNVTYFFLPLLLFLSLSDCKKKSDSPEINSSTLIIKLTKFEITEIYSGQLLVVYSDNMSGNTSVTVTSLPWSKTIDYPNFVISIGIGGKRLIQNMGASEKIGSLKICNSSSFLKFGSVPTDVNGLYHYQL